MLQLFGYLSALLILAGPVIYIRDTLHLKTKPQRITWLIFSVLGAIAFFSQLAKGASNSLWLSGAITVAVVTIFVLSLKYGVGGSSKKDQFILIGAGLGLIGWYLTKEAAVALYFTITLDALGSYLTLEKAYHHPESETSILWLLSSLGGLTAAFAVGSWNFVLLSYPIAIFLMDGSIFAAIMLGKKKFRTS